MPQKFQRLTTLCRACISLNLDRFPPEALGILNEEEWDSIVKLRHLKTTPQVGSGGLDGTGRLHPAVSEKVLLRVEQSNPHFRYSDIADRLLWKDIVEYKYRKGGVARPKGLNYPWDVLVQQITEAGDALNAVLPPDENDSTVIDRKHVHDKAIEATRTLDGTAMNLNLLKETGIGKTVKKFLKKVTRDPSSSVKQFLTTEIRFEKDRSSYTVSHKLEMVLQRWMDMASQNGVKIETGDKMTSKGQNILDNSTGAKDDDRFLQIAKQCRSWRDLYEQIKTFDDNRRSKQGEKMRERRDRLDSIRPKIVKVRIKKHVIEEKRLAAASASTHVSVSKSTLKMQKLRKEASITAMRQQRPSGSAAVSSSRSGRSNFSSAVANAMATNPRNVKRKAPPGVPPTKSIALGDGKQMRIPDMKRTSNVHVQKRMKMLKNKQANIR
jgi:TFIIS helical bundle-like domain